MSTNTKSFSSVQHEIAQKLLKILESDPDFIEKKVYQEEYLFITIPEKTKVETISAGFIDIHKWFDKVKNSTLKKIFECYDMTVYYNFHILRKESDCEHVYSGNSRRICNYYSCLCREFYIRDRVMNKFNLDEQQEIIEKQIRVLCVKINFEIKDKLHPGTVDNLLYVRN